MSDWYVVCLGNLWHLSHMLPFTYSFFDIYAGTRQVWSVQQKSALKDLVKTAALKRKPPTRNEILIVQQKNPCLAGKTWQSIKYQAWALHQQAARQRSRVTSKLLRWHLSESVVTTFHCHDNSAETAEFKSLSVAWNYSLIFCIVLLLFMCIRYIICITIYTYVR